LSDRSGPTSSAFPPAAAWWADRTGAFVAFSPRWEALTGRDLAKELGGGWLDGVHPEDLGLWNRTFHAALAAASEFRCDLRLRAGVRWAWVRMHGLPELDVSGRLRGFAGSATEITDLKRASHEQDGLLQAAVHDLRAPLRNLAHLLGEVESGEADCRALAHARALASRLDVLLRDLLEYSAVGRGASLRAEQVEASQAFEWARENLTAQIRQARAELDVAALPAVRVDPIHLGRVFQNLLSNALLHSGRRPPRISVRATREPGLVRFALSDRGVGIPPDAQESIFDAFQRLSGEDVPGNGLGLAICRRLVELHGGRIWVESQPGDGATFYFTLPSAG
jgi:PAS domain S-box-containing protein